MSEWDQTGMPSPPPPPPGWGTGEPADPAWQERTLRGLGVGQRLFGRFVLGRVLGQGGMGVVWLAEDKELGEPIALKFLPEGLVHDAAALDDLRDEVRKSRRLTHPNIVRVHDFHHDETRGTAAISMEYVDGANLSALRVERPNRIFEPREVEGYIWQLCGALDYAHGRGIIHRDLKPVNLMVDAAGVLKVCDFGIACSIRDSITRVTGRRSTGGTLVYMSPQQLDGGGPSPADDIYSLGATIYELLTGKPPFFSGDIPGQIRAKAPPVVGHRRGELGVIGELIPSVWDAVVAGCLAKEPGLRPRSAEEVAGRLRSTSVPRRPATSVQQSAVHVQRRAEDRLPVSGDGPNIPQRVPHGAAVVASGHQSRNIRKRRNLVAALALLLLMAVGVAGWFGWRTHIQTRLVCHVTLDGYEVGDTAYLMNPLIAEIERLHQQYIEQRELLSKDSERRKEAVAVAEKKAKDIDSRLALARQNLVAVEARQTAGGAGENSQVNGEVLGRFKSLDAEMERTREEFRRAITERARRIQIQFSDDRTDNEPDLIVSRFRTGLYGAGTGVDRKTEQVWAEGQLAHWRKYYEDWRSQRDVLQEQYKLALNLLDARQKSELEQAKSAVTESEKDAQDARAAVDAARKALDDVRYDPNAIERALLAQMDELPEKFQLAEARRRGESLFAFEHLDRKPATPPGRYVVFVRARKGEEEYWGFLGAEVLRREETVFRMFPDHLLSKRRMLVEGKFENPPQGKVGAVGGSTQTSDAVRGDKASMGANASIALSTGPVRVSETEVTSGRRAKTVDSVPLEMADEAKAARLAFDKEDFEAAAVQYGRILSRYPDNLYALSNLGVVRFQQGKFEAAEQVLADALRVAPDDAFSLAIMGIVHYMCKRFDQAVDFLSRSAALNPTDAQTHNYLGIASSRKGWQQVAEQEVRKAIELNPNYADAHFNLAVIYATKDPPAKEMARDHYNKAVQLGLNSDPELEKLIK